MLRFGTVTAVSVFLSMLLVGCSSEVGLEKVTADRSNYEGKTVVSSVILDGMNDLGLWVHPPLGEGQALKVSDASLNKKVWDILRATHGIVKVKYKVIKEGNSAIGELVDIWIP